MDISKIKAVFPDFQMEHFNKFDQIVRLNWEMTYSQMYMEEHAKLVLEMTSSDNYKIVLKCKDVHSLHFHGESRIAGFCIEDMSPRGFQADSRYHIRDYENDELEFFCSEVFVKSFSPCED